jgi:ketosteroid isomerase-like protein
MSQENVEIVRASHAAYIRGDSDAALKDFDQSGAKGRTITGTDIRL